MAFETLMDKVNAFDGAFALWWLGQMGYIVRAGKLTLLLDAYLTDDPARRIPPLLSPAQLRGVDFVFGSHDHLDHIDDCAWRRIADVSPKTRFIVPALLADKIAARLDIERARFVGVDERQPFRGESLRVFPVAAAHEFLDADPATGFHPALGYLVEFDSIRFFHAGDTCRYDGYAEKIARRGPLDCLILPINGRDGARYRAGIIGNMTFCEAVDLAGQIAPRVVLPAHYDMFEGNTEDPARFMDYLDAKYPTQRAWVGRHGECVDLSHGKNSGS